MMMVYSKNEIISRLRDILDGIWQLDLCEGENYIHINDDCVTPQQSKAIGKSANLNEVFKDYEIPELGQM